MLNSASIKRGAVCFTRISRKRLNSVVVENTNFTNKSWQGFLFLFNALFKGDAYLHEYVTQLREAELLCAYLSRICVTPIK